MEAPSLCYTWICLHIPAFSSTPTHSATSVHSCMDTQKQNLQRAAERQRSGGSLSLSSAQCCAPQYALVCVCLVMCVHRDSLHWFTMRQHYELWNTTHKKKMVREQTTRRRRMLQEDTGFYYFVPVQTAGVCCFTSSLPVNIEYSGDLCLNLLLLVTAALKTF